MRGTFEGGGQMTTRIFTAAALVALAATAPVHGQAAAASAAVQTQATQSAMTPATALARLKDGNAKFAAGKSTPHDYPGQVKATATGQYPFAAVVSCMDSRVTPEITFDCGLGDIFGLREAGNV